MRQHGSRPAGHQRAARNWALRDCSFYVSTTAELSNTNGPTISQATRGMYGHCAVTDGDFRTGAREGIARVTGEAPVIGQDDG